MTAAAALALALLAAAPPERAAPLAQEGREQGWDDHELESGAPLLQAEGWEQGWDESDLERSAPLAQQEGWEGWDEDELDDAPRLFLGAWGGEALGEVGQGSSSAVLGGEVAWAFRALDLGLAGYAYRKLDDAEREWTPVALVRILQRFETRPGLEATFALGLGAGRPDGWSAWYQVALGGRATFGPLFVAGEISFEQYDLLRLAAGLGVAL